MAPDKIYINVHPLGVDYSIVPIPNFGGVEYIRKDALLDKLNLALKLRTDGNPDINTDGVQTIKAIINYINAL